MGAIGKTKRLLRKPFNSLGLDIVRLDTRQFEPTNETEFLWLSSLDLNTIIDAGAHTGEFAAMIHKILPRASILSFEPLRDAFEQLENNMRGVPGFKAFNCALGDSNTQLHIHRNEFTDSSSLRDMAELHKQAFPFTAKETLEAVEQRRLDDVLSGVELKDNILLKIDTQGYEDKVIEGAPELIERARAIITEVSFQTLYEGQPLFDDIYELLKERGFRYMGNLDEGMGSLPQLRNPLDGSVLQANAIFLKG
jgi:FkbM family methyltransferase